MGKDQLFVQHCSSRVFSVHTLPESSFVMPTYNYVQAFVSNLASYYKNEKHRIIPRISHWHAVLHD